MSVIVVTGSAGLVGSESARHFAAQGFDVVGIDNDLRASFFGPGASTRRNRSALERAVPAYVHHDVDIRDPEAIGRIFAGHGSAIAAVVHTAAQPSHDWAARDPETDFGVNATGTLRLLEATRRHCPEAVFIFTSTNKVYGDTPNRLPMEELDLRWEPAADHPFHARGIDESMSVDDCLHSLFGVSKLAADVMVQEYGRYFGMRTACFRAGCLTGPQHAGAELHGFLAWLVKCAVTSTPYTVYGYGGKQVRDNLHSADLVSAFWEFFLAPRSAAVYNMGGGRRSNCSMLEAIARIRELTGREIDWRYEPRARIGDHIWWISDTARFEADYPAWSVRHDVDAILTEIGDAIAT